MFHIEQSLNGCLSMASVTKLQPKLTCKVNSLSLTFPSGPAGSGCSGDGFGSLSPLWLSSARCWQVALTGQQGGPLTPRDLPG